MFSRWVILVCNLVSLKGLVIKLFVFSFSFFLCLMIELCVVIIRMCMLCICGLVCMVFMILYFEMLGSMMFSSIRLGWWLWILFSVLVLVVRWVWLWFVWVRRNLSVVVILFLFLMIRICVMLVFVGDVGFCDRVWWVWGLICEDVFFMCVVWDE